MKKTLFALLAVTAVLGAGLLAMGPFEAQAGPPKQPETIDLAAGEELYAENCASCHGVNLEGQDNWRSPGPDGVLPAPPHDQTGHTWHHGDALIFNYTKLGGKASLAEQGIEFNSGMPGFGEALSDQEIWNIVGFIKSTWPERVQEVQSVRTESEQLRGK